MSRQEVLGTESSLMVGIAENIVKTSDNNRFISSIAADNLLMFQACLLECDCLSLLSDNTELRTSIVNRTTSEH